jgi:hypothetical protein
MVKQNTKLYGGSSDVPTVIRKQKAPYARRDKSDLQYERVIVQ